MVNRIWQWHFGKGLVATPSNFGLRGEAPSHPQLLDWLALELIRSRWSMKQMHRQILLSRTYQMSSTGSEEGHRTDPGNRWLSRFSVRRLEAEAIRDAFFATAGNLETHMGGSLMSSPNYKRVDLQPDADVYQSPRRAVYLPVVRVRAYDMMTAFDFQSSGQHISSRPVTTSPQQALFLLNNPLVFQQAKRMAGQVQSWAVESERERIRRLYMTLYGRPPTQTEWHVIESRLQRFKASLASHLATQAESDAAAWTAICHALYAANEFIFVK